MNSSRSKKLGIAAALAGLLTTVGVAPGHASASSSCPVERFCLYFNSNLQGARADLAHSDASLSEELFTDGPSGRNGWGVVVNNNAASMTNNTHLIVVLYDGRNCTGNSHWFYPGARGNISLELKNRVSSVLLTDSGSSANKTACIVRDQSRF